MPKYIWYSKQRVKGEGKYKCIFTGKLNIEENDRIRKLHLQLTMKAQT